MHLPESAWSLEYGSHKVHFWSLYPLYAEELELKLNEGSDALLDRFEKHRVTDLLDPWRVNTCRKKRFFLF